MIEAEGVEAERVRGGEGARGRRRCIPPSSAVTRKSLPSWWTTANESGIRIAVKPGLCAMMHSPSFTVSRPLVPPAALQSLRASAWIPVAVAVATSITTIAEFSWQLT